MHLHKQSAAMYQTTKVRFFSERAIVLNSPLLSRTDESAKLAEYIDSCCLQDFFLEAKRLLAADF